MSAVQIIAEIGQAHDGSVGILHSYIDALADTGVDAVKFQMHIAASESSAHEPFRKAFSYVDATRFDYWRRMELSESQWAEVRDHCARSELEFLVSPFSVEAVRRLEGLGVTRYKVGSGEVTNLLMLEQMGRTGKPIILSSGLSTFDDLDPAIQLLRGHGCPISVLQCATRYPTRPQDYGFNAMAELRARYGTPVGFSDHSGKPHVPIAAVAQGAQIVEFHVVFDRRMFGPDSAASLTIDETAQVCTAIRDIRQALDAPVDKSLQPSESAELRQMFGKSLAVNCDLPVGHVLGLDDLESKKPAGQGIAAADYSHVLGRRIARAMKQGEFLRDEDLERP